MKGQRVGTFGDIGYFSYYPTKGCGAFGDVGCITTNDSDFAQNFVYSGITEAIIIITMLLGRTADLMKYRLSHSDWVALMGRNNQYADNHYLGEKLNEEIIRK